MWNEWVVMVQFVLDVFRITEKQNKTLQLAPAAALVSGFQQAKDQTKLKAKPLPPTELVTISGEDKNKLV